MTSVNPEPSTSRTPLLSRIDIISSTDAIHNPTHPPFSESVHTDAVAGPLLPKHPEEDEEASTAWQSQSSIPAPTVSIGRMVSVLVIGAFVANIDSSIMLATHPIIASEFNALHDSSWLMISFGLAETATLPLYGKLSDIYGRKIMLLLAYALVTIGCVLVGIGNSMNALVLGRVITGAGCSGMTTLASVLITDSVPLRDVAAWRSYLNVAATTARSLGGPLGGWLADTVGWRWSFLGQAIPLAMAICLLAVTIPSDRGRHDQDGESESKLGRIDFLGAILMTCSILGFLIPLEIGGERVPWSSPAIITLFLGAAALGILFLIVEGTLAKEPIMPVSLLRNRDVLASNVAFLLSSAAQNGLMFTVPLYFQVTAGASNAVAGAHLTPAVVGNAIGGILSAAIIKRTGRYKFLIVLATLIAATGYSSLVVRWHGHTGFFESLYIFPGGFAMGVLGSAIFIGVQAAIDPSLVAIATSTSFLALSFGFVAGMATVTAVLQETLKHGLHERLAKLGLGQEQIRKIIEEATSDVHFVDKTQRGVADAVKESYVDALTWTHALSVTLSLSAFVATFFVREYPLA